MISKENAAPAKKPPFHFKKTDRSIEKARLQLIGVCLLDRVYVLHLPASIHFSEYGAFIIALIQRGMGLEAIVRHLEEVGIGNAYELLSDALQAVPDGVELGYVFWHAVKVLAGSSRLS